MLARMKIGTRILASFAVAVLPSRNAAFREF